MYPRLISPPKGKSFFLFGPRGTGKSTWIVTEFKADLVIDLLDSETYQTLLAQPSRLSQFITGKRPNYVVIDEVQRVPELLNEVHRLIESERLRFVLTGSSARKLKREHANLLGGRAITLKCFPLTALELGKDFQLINSLRWGHLPSIFSESDKRKYLKTYIGTYLREEVLQESRIRNLSAFSRFLEAASFSQGSPLNMSAVAREVGIDRKVIEDYFTILEDLLIGVRLPVFQKRAKRKRISHSKFYYFDVGVFRSLCPQGPLDDTSSLQGIALESLVFQELRALNEYLEWECDLFFWHTQTHEEVDFVLYGSKGFWAIEVKLSQKWRERDLQGLSLFNKEYPEAECYLLYAGSRRWKVGNIQIIPVEMFLRNPKEFVHA